jgi:hypothetical protein
MKRKRIGTRNYYLLKQVDNDNMDICEGCVFLGLRENGSNKCPTRADTTMLCQEIETDLLTDYIFVPATKQGLADYVAHKLEYS